MMKFKFLPMVVLMVVLLAGCSSTPKSEYFSQRELPDGNTEEVIDTFLRINEPPIAEYSDYSGFRYRFLVSGSISQSIICFTLVDSGFGTVFRSRIFYLGGNKAQCLYDQARVLTLEEFFALTSNIEALEKFSLDYMTPEIWSSFATLDGSSYYLETWYRGATDTPDVSNVYVAISPETVKYAKNLPLTLKILFPDEEIDDIEIVQYLEAFLKFMACIEKLSGIDYY